MKPIRNGLLVAALGGCLCALTGCLSENLAAGVATKLRVACDRGVVSASDTAQSIIGNSALIKNFARQVKASAAQQGVAVEFNLDGFVKITDCDLTSDAD